eukprot:358965-Prymnesium_polylepis.2
MLPVGLKYPGSDGMQSSDLARLVTFEYEPASHLSGAAAPSLQYEPRSHGLHDRKHSARRPDGATVPAAQSAGATLPVWENHPGDDGMHSAALARSLPASQGRGIVVAVVGQRFPGGQRPPHSESSWCATSSEPSTPGAQANGKSRSSRPCGNRYIGEPRRPGDVFQSQGWSNVLAVHCLVPTNGAAPNSLSGSVLHASKTATHCRSGTAPYDGHPSR